MRPIDADKLRERLQNLAYDDWNQGITTSFADACHEIIDIIEEQPTIEPSAQPYALDEWCDTCKEYDHEKHCCPRYNRVIRDAMKMRKRGKWERLSIRPNVYGDLRWYCSSCGYSTLDDWASTWSYCPQCGCDMREGKEE